MKGMPLQRLQADFQDYVLGTQREHAPLAALIADQFGLPVQGRLAIYYDAYRIRLHDALSEAFGKTHAYVGDDMFGELGAAYITQHPSHYRNLRWFGGAFPAFLAQRLPEHPVVAELAGFEWALGLAFDAADAPALRAERVQALSTDDWEQVGFEMPASQQLLALYWNAPAIWLALENGLTPPDAVGNESACTWLVWRKDLQPHFRSLDPLEALALQGLARGLSFSAVCAELAGLAGADITPRVATWLHGWLGEAVLSGIRPVGVDA
jgi:hypothetical protein